MTRLRILLALAAGLGVLALSLGPHFHGAPSPTPVPVSNPGGFVNVARSGGSLELSARTSHPVVAAGRTQEVFVSASLRGVKVPGALRRPLDLALVIDRSGSMAGDRLDNAKRAARELIAKLGDQDQLTLIHFGSEVRVLPTRLATASNKEAMLRDVASIEDDGGTNIGAALEAARTVLARSPREQAVRRILLVSDGEPTEGDTDPASLRMLARGIKRSGMRVSSIGVGTDFNEDLMSSFAEEGAGSYGYLRNTEQLAGLFQKDLEQATTVVARDVELSFTLPADTELVEVLGYASQQEGRTVKVPMTDFAAGQEERVVARLRVTPQVAAGQSFQLADVEVRYDDVLAHGAAKNELALNAAVSDSAERVLAQRDGTAAVDAARALSARNLQAAAGALASGAPEKAKELLEQNRSLFIEAQAAPGAPSMSKDIAGEAEMERGVTAAASAGGGDRDDAVKLLKKSARRSFGRMGSTY